MKITPAQSSTFTITADPTWPSVVFQSDATGKHTWNWTISWKTFTKSGSETTDDNRWDAAAAIANRGGTLTVRVAAGRDMTSLSVTIKGTNPTPQQVTNYLSTKTGADGFDRILAHETHTAHFDARGEPIKSFDNGFGMAQLTSPAPSFDQVWNWKLNIDGGLKLFATKRNAAIVYLSQQSRTYTDDQLKYETVCRWNGGEYHAWDKKQGWVRNPNIVCDGQTGNIGWDMTDSENQGKTAAELHKRDSGAYSRARAAGDHWRYFGVCYADAILG